LVKKAASGAVAAEGGEAPPGADECRTRGEREREGLAQEEHREDRNERTAIQTARRERSLYSRVVRKFIRSPLKSHTVTLWFYIG